MDIRKIGQPQNTYDTSKVRKEKVRDEERERRGDDSVELSPEAVKLFQAEENKKIEMVRDRIQSGYYFRPEVVDRVASELLQQFTQS
jgi:anti-sigma28 factor (negative regulator of flagellin synthesis)